MLTVYLVGMPDGTSRACRAAWSLGADRVVLIDSAPPKARHLQSARRLQIDTMPPGGILPPDVLVLEVSGRIPLAEVDWGAVSGIAVGGASFTFSSGWLYRHPSARIPSRRPCLIGDQAITAALYARSLVTPVPPC